MQYIFVSEEAFTSLKYLTVSKLPSLLFPLVLTFCITFLDLSICGIEETYIIMLILKIIRPWDSLEMQKYKYLKRRTLFLLQWKIYLLDTKGYSLFEQKIIKAKMLFRSYHDNTEWNKTEALTSNMNCIKMFDLIHILPGSSLVTVSSFIDKSIKKIVWYFNTWELLPLTDIHKNQFNNFCKGQIILCQVEQA